MVPNNSSVVICQIVILYMPIVYLILYFYFHFIYNHEVILLYITKLQESFEYLWRSLKSSFPETPEKFFG